MVNQKETLEILNKDANYEDKLAQDILTYCGMCEDSITDIDSETKKKIIEMLTQIRSDSEKHEILIRKLVGMVLNKGEQEY